MMSCNVKCSDPWLMVILCVPLSLGQRKRKVEKVPKLERDAATLLAAPALHSDASH